MKAVCRSSMNGMRSSTANSVEMNAALPSAGLDVSAWRQRLEAYQVKEGLPLFVLGCFDRNVTVLSQQVRALNLTTALFEALAIPTSDEEQRSLAIVGAGFAGLTLAAALIKKQAKVKITIFEERDTLLPFQQGSDSRWLHPKIYDWPADQSESSAAMLPVLNWTAGRASDVVVQVLAEWNRIAEEQGVNLPFLYCNTRHLHISREENYLRLEWVGEERDPRTGHARTHDKAIGYSEKFDIVVLAVGFGVEKDESLSYWRNETLGQPSLTHSRATYLVSGQGDGAMIDLLRLRVSQYRQDRILEELFYDKKTLVNKLRHMKSKSKHKTSSSSLFEQFEQLSSEKPSEEWNRLLAELRERLRRDTEVVLHLKSDVRNLADLSKRRISFQNALLVFLLYKCGGFVPSTEKESRLCKRHGIQEKHVIRRHGPDPRAQVARLLSDDLVPNEEEIEDRLQQSVESQWWPGGYFGFPGRLSDAQRVPSNEREAWRKEYLPGPTSVVAATLCCAIAGALEGLRPDSIDRVTLHRVTEINGEPLLQQTCDYAGRTEPPKKSPAGRIFPVEMATIGQAYATRYPIRSLRNATPQQLQQAMDLPRKRATAPRTVARHAA
jgi:FAD dependent oxidoreductase